MNSIAFWLMIVIIFVPGGLIGLWFFAALAYSLFGGGPTVDFYDGRKP